jgi:hypothetical protein
VRPCVPEDADEPGISSHDAGSKSNLLDVTVGSWKRCPRCGSRELVEIIYGTPEDPRTRELWLRGKLMLRRPNPAGRCVPPGWACRECGFGSLPEAAVASTAGSHGP